MTKAKGTSVKYRPEQIFSLSQEENKSAPGDKMMQLNSGLHGKVGSIEKWLLIVIVILGAVCLLCCVCCIIHLAVSYEVNAALVERPTRGRLEPKSDKFT